ncbi:MAG: hypothetical protein WBC69_13380 [Geitlerinemataceae cyanobacterium]
MSAPTDIRQRAIQLIDRLPAETLLRAVEFLETLCRETNAENNPLVWQLNEDTLVQIIQRQLPPKERDRLAYLRQQNECGEITDIEHQELLTYVELVEQQDAERAEALIQLAQLRNVDLKELLREFLPFSGVPDAV